MVMLTARILVQVMVIKMVKTLDKIMGTLMDKMLA
jgi:hypothetical protein